MVIRDVLTAGAGIVLVAGIIWFFKRNWHNLMEILDSLDEPEEKEKAD